MIKSISQANFNEEIKEGIEEMSGFKPKTAIVELVNKYL